MKKFIEYVIKQLVDKPAEVHVDEIYGEHTVIFALHVGDGDMGKVIGKRGQTVDSLRTILAAAAAKQGKRSVLEIVDMKRMTYKNWQNEYPVGRRTAQTPVSEFKSNDEIRWQDDGGNNL
jgi:predicted RNA-binding protein YlqC (UPF0109 family)